MDKWDVEAFEKMNDWERDRYIDQVLRKNRTDDDVTLTTEQIKYRQKRETNLHYKNVTKNERKSLAKRGLEVDYAGSEFSFGSRV